MTTVEIAPNRAMPGLLDGHVLPPLVQSETPSSVTLVVDSSKRYYGNDGAFRVKLYYNIPRPRYLQLKNMVFPKLPNVTNMNNTISINHNGNDYTFTIPVGMYNTTSMCNALTLAFNSALGLNDSVTTTYSQLTRNFTISSVGGIDWYFTNCSFIERGTSLCGFSVGTFPGAPSWSSGVAGMLYTRYLVVCSNTLCQYNYATSLISGTNQFTNVIGIVDLAGMYDVYDFDVSVPYSGIYKNIDVNGPYLALMNSERILKSELDFEIYDSYGSPLNDTLTSVGINTLGVSLIMNISM